MDEQERANQIERWLKLIERTRLFCNTAEELGQLVGFSVSNRNSLARKGGRSLFMKEAIFYQMAHLCKEQTGLDLQTVVEAYEDVDNFIDRYEAKLRSEEILPQLVVLFYGSGETDQDLSFVTKRLNVTHAPILLLMLLGCLPRRSAKNGDVQDIEADFKRTFAFLHQVCQVPSFQTIPALASIEDSVGSDAGKHTRLVLISVVSDVLDAYGAISTQMRLSQTTREILKDQYVPDIGGIWTENDSYTSFWYMERLINGFHMYHYVLKGDQKTLSYTKYFISFYDDEDVPLAIVVHPKSIRYTVECKPVPHNHFAYLNFEQLEDELRFTPRGKDGEWFSLSRLVRSKHPNFYQSLLDDESKIRVNEFANDDYQLLFEMVAITNDSIYLRNGESGYYKVPKDLNEVLEDVHFGDNVGILSFVDATYIAFDDKSLYYDVTTEEKMKALGIEVVESLTP